MVPVQQKTIRGPVKLIDIHSSGRSVALHINKKVYIDFGIPGEEVTYYAYRKKQGFRSGEVVDIISSSASRTIPKCRHFGECGGCTWQHIDYSCQLMLKHAILCNALSKYEITTPEVPPVIASPEIYNYRHRLEYVFDKNSYTKEHNNRNNQGIVGFHKFNEPDKIIGIDECYLQPEPSRSICEYIKTYSLNNQLDFYDHSLKTGFLRSLSVRMNQKNEIILIIGLNEDKPYERNELLNAVIKKFPSVISLCYTIHKSEAHSQMQGEIISFGRHAPYLYETVSGIQFRMHATSFFQPNVKQAGAVFDMVREWADLKGDELVYDLYTGVGTIALFLARHAKKIIGIEGSILAIEDARENAKLNAIENTNFITGDILATFKPDFLEKNGGADVIILDPPRSGTLIEIKKTINLSGAKKVIYLSCNPVSLAFDLKQLTEVYKVTRIQPFDMLPNTHHLETLVLLEKM